MSNKQKYTCPICGPDHILHQIEDDIWGCDNCKGIFTERDIAKHVRDAAQTRHKDEFGNDLIPEAIL